MKGVATWLFQKIRFRNPVAICAVLTIPFRQRRLMNAPIAEN